MHEQLTSVATHKYLLVSVKGEVNEKHTVPLVLGTSPSTAAKRDVFPDPTSPQTATFSPALTNRFIFFRVGFDAFSSHEKLQEFIAIG